MNRRKMIWLVISMILAGCIIWTITSQCGSFSFSELCLDIKNSNKIWFLAGVISMLGFVYFEGASLNVIIKALDKKGKSKGIVYSASDIFFSAITPSASGGQPASAYFMMRDNISGSIAMISLLINLIMYTFSLMIAGTISIIAFWNLFREYSLLGKLMVYIGFAILIISAIVFILLIFDELLLQKIANKLFDILVKLHFIRNVDKRRAKLDYLLEEYRDCADAIYGHMSMLIKAFILNALQRICQISVSVFMFLAVEGPAKCAFEVLAVQVLALVGSNGVPIPGAMGAIDYLLLEGFTHIPEIDSVANMELLVRGVSFYICVGICGLITLFAYFRKRGK